MESVIVIGSGLAAIHFVNCLPENIEISWVLGKGNNQSNSYLAKGGIAISTLNKDLKEHIQDSIVAGCGICNENIVREVVEGSKDVFSRLKREGILFDEEPSKEGGHSRSRIQHVSDQTGKFLVEQLWQQILKKRNTRLLFNWVLADLVIEGNACVGTDICNLKTGSQRRIFADGIVLATSGCGNLFQYHTNSNEANGEGYAIASRAGAKLRDMEFMQFHPTKLYSENLNENILITEAFRGAGAKLVGQHEKDFMLQYYKMGSLAPRDIVALGIYKQMIHDGSPYVWLDFSEVNEDDFRNKFPYLFEIISHKSYLKDQKIPVTPAAHYQCGGVEVDAHCRTNIARLFAVGEVARTGLHGANRLASNSLLELLYFSEKLANTISQMPTLVERDTILLPNLKLGNSIEIADLMKELKYLMWDCFGIVRTQKQMTNGLIKLNRMHQNLLQIDTETLAHKRFKNALETAIIIAISALNRNESIGCHQLQQLVFQLAIEPLLNT